MNFRMSLIYRCHGQPLTRSNTLPNHSDRISLHPAAVHATGGLNAIRDRALRVDKLRLPSLAIGRGSSATPCAPQHIVGGKIRGICKFRQSERFFIRCCMRTRRSEVPRVCKCNDHAKAEDLPGWIVMYRLRYFFGSVVSQAKTSQQQSSMCMRSLQRSGIDESPR